MLRPFIIYTFICFISFKSYCQSTISYDYSTAKKALSTADKYSSQEVYNQEKADRMYAKALKKYHALVNHLKENKDVPLLFLAYTDLGFLYYYFDSIHQAKSAYLHAIGIHNKDQSLSDSVLFSSLLFVGSIYYRQNDFDSAQLYLKKALRIQDKFLTPLPDAQRLYNWLGGMYYETGNYKQAKNYFEKALEMLKRHNPYFRDLTIRYKNNIAACLVKLEKYQEADSIYNTLLKSTLNTNEILNNLGIVNLKANKVGKALEYFKKVQFSNALTVTLFNHIGKSYQLLKMPDSADFYYNKALEANEKWQPGKKNVMHGYTFQYMAEKLQETGKLELAADYYQKAINQYYTNFNETDPFRNPTLYTGIFSYIDLFNVLIAKADVLNNIYTSNKQPKYLHGSLDTYQSAFKLINYVEHVYDNDEARLFLNKIKYNVHDRPIQCCLQLFNLTKNKKYLEYAFEFDQQSKASILALNVQELLLKSQIENNELWNEEASIKNKTTRLLIKAARITDSSQLVEINNNIRDNEIQLSKIQSEKNEILVPQGAGSSLNESDITHLQKRLNKNTAIVSYHLSEDELLILCITNRKITHTLLSIDTIFFKLIQVYKQSILPNRSSTKFEGYDYGKKLYRYLISPVADILKSKNHLIIIPDDELNSMPFESLQNEQETFLIEDYCIQYQYTAALLTTGKKKNKNTQQVMAMAPYASQNIKSLPKLPYSKYEIENLDGEILYDQEASKHRFLSEIKNYPIIHLATHTIINENYPENSFISFYPSGENAQIENDLYLPEIYNLNLESNQLVILSSCETGIGKLTKGEGLMSLSRAFSYAGSKNNIASLWKADDKSTAWIIKRFYRHLYNNNTIARSLHKAKIDYLHSPAIESRYKSPDFWAHLVLTGALEEQDDTGLTIFIMLGILIGIIVWYIGKKFKLNVKS